MLGPVEEAALRFENRRPLGACGHAMPRSSCRWSGAGGRGLQRAVCWFTLPSPECVLLRPSTKGPMWQSFYWYHPCAPSRLQVGPDIDTLSSQPQQPPMNSWAA